MTPIEFSLKKPDYPEKILAVQITGNNDDEIEMWIQGYTTDYYEDSDIWNKAEITCDKGYVQVKLDNAGPFEHTYIGIGDYVAQDLENPNDWFLIAEDEMRMFYE